MSPRYAGQITVIGIHSPKITAERDPANLGAALRRHEVAYPVVVGPDPILWRQYAVRAWPNLIAVDARGRVLARHEGEIALPDLLESVGPFLGPGGSGTAAAMPPSTRPLQSPAGRSCSRPG